MSLREKRKKRVEHVPGVKIKNFWINDEKDNDKKNVDAFHNLMHLTREY